MQSNGIFSSASYVSGTTSSISITYSIATAYRTRYIASTEAITYRAEWISKCERTINYFSMSRWSRGNHYYTSRYGNCSAKASGCGTFYGSLSRNFSGFPDYRYSTTDSLYNTVSNRFFTYWSEDHAAYVCPREARRDSIYSNENRPWEV